MFIYNKRFCNLFETKKSPRGISPRRCSLPPLGGIKYVKITQDKSPWLCSERHDEYFFGRAKTGGLGRVTTKKNAPGALDPAVFPPPLVVQNTVRSLKT